MMDFTPPDCAEETKRCLTDNGGCCGQACLAVVQRLSIAEVFRRWELHGFEWKGHSPNTQIREYLEKEGYTIKLITKKHKTNFKAPFYFLRVQWIGDGEKKGAPFYGWNHWSIASANTHFLLKEGERIFCNENGWMPASHLESYLKDNKPEGIVTSLYEIKVRD
jgi:hypothetical protein